MTNQITTYSSANGPASAWALHIPTQVKGGIHAKVRMDHRDGGILVTLTDADGTWRRIFEVAEDFADWLDGIAVGPVVLVDNQKRPERFIGAAA